MNRDSDITKNILLRLLLESDSVADDRSGAPHLTNAMPPNWPQPAASSPGDEPSPPSELGRAHSDSSDQLEPFEQNLLDYSIGADPNPVFDPGDLPVVQNHFEAILKRRLAAEISQRPPLFPWEKGLQDYPDILTPDDGLVSVWLEHLQNLELPTDLPQDVLAELLRQCQQAADQTRQIGRRLVSAVESLFPDQPQTLAYIAGLVARPAYRSTQTGSLVGVDYATASAQQQIALTMLAAQSIFEALSLTVSPATPTATRTWLTVAGALTVSATYLSPDRLEVKAHLPQAGAIVLTGEPDILHADRSTPGDLVMQVALPSALPSTYTLEVSLGDYEAAPLRFQLAVEPD